jgi:hypothetical protein
MRVTLEYLHIHNQMQRTVCVERQTTLTIVWYADMTKDINEIETQYLTGVVRSTTEHRLETK